MQPERDRLQQGAQQLGLALTDTQCDTLLAYQALIAKWNRVYNLTALRDPAEMLTHHLLDSLALIQPLQRHLAGQPARILDVGSGAGLPGIVVATLIENCQVVCVDTVGEKASFIRQAGAELGLKNLQAEHARVEELKLPSFDVITSRAFASLLDFTQLTRALLKPGSIWLAMKGKVPTEEQVALPADVDVFHVEHLTVPGLDAERCLVWMRLKEAGSLA